jgi:poly-gamma-glutamate synthesis protein (capsule biosynthesis protein)
MLQRPIADLEHQGLRGWQERFQTASLVFTNLELALTNRGERADKLVNLRADPELAGELPRFGVDVATLANNHAMDYGLTGLRDTLAACAAADLPTVGAGEDATAAMRPQILSRGGLRVAFLGFATTLALGASAAPDRPGLAGIRVVSRYVVDPVTVDENPGIAPYVETELMPGDADQAAFAVAQAKAAADVVVVGMHWGIPHGWTAAFQRELADYQQPLAHRLIDAGADAIFGHHPHVLHGIEVYRERPIFYSLGNFVFHSITRAQPELGRPYPFYSWRSLRSELNHLGGVARLTWHAAGRPASAEFLPVRLDAAGDACPAGASDAEAALSRVEMLSEAFGAHLSRTDQGLRIALEA